MSVADELFSAAVFEELVPMFLYCISVCKYHCHDLIGVSGLSIARRQVLCGKCLWEVLVNKRSL